jgi:hypothetical protein
MSSATGSSNAILGCLNVISRGVGRVATCLQVLQSLSYLFEGG